MSSSVELHPLFVSAIDTLRHLPAHQCVDEETIVLLVQAHHYAPDGFKSELTALLRTYSPCVLPEFTLYLEDGRALISDVQLAGQLGVPLEEVRQVLAEWREQGLLKAYPLNSQTLHRRQ